MLHSELNLMLIYSACRPIILITISKIIFYFSPSFLSLSPLWMSFIFFNFMSRMRDKYYRHINFDLVILKIASCKT